MLGVTRVEVMNRLSAFISRSIQHIKKADKPVLPNLINQHNDLFHLWGSFIRIFIFIYSATNHPAGSLPWSSQSGFPGYSRLRCHGQPSAHNLLGLQFCLSTKPCHYSHPTVQQWQSNLLSHHEKWRRILPLSSKQFSWNGVGNLPAKSVWWVQKFSLLRHSLGLFPNNIRILTGKLPNLINEA